MLSLNKYIYKLNNFNIQLSALKKYVSIELKSSVTEIFSIDSILPPPTLFLPTPIPLSYPPPFYSLC